MAQEAPLATAWQGINRLLAPHLLGETESPDTTDAAQYGNQLGILGPRGGRKRVANRTYNLQGVLFGNFPFAKQRVYADANGDWTPVTVPAGTPLTNLPGAGWDKIDITSLSASQTGNGTTNGTSKSLSLAVQLSNYGLVVFGATSPYSVIDFALSGGASDGQVMLQGKIGGVWTDLLKVTTLAGVNDVIQMYSSGTGILTDVRAQATINAGGGDLAVTFNTSMYLAYGNAGAAVSVA